MNKPNALQNCISYRTTKEGIEFFVGPRKYLCILSPLGLDSEDSLAEVRRLATQAALGMVSIGDPLGPQELGEGWSQLELWPAQVKMIRSAAVLAGTIPSLTPTELAKALGISRQAVNGRIASGSLETVLSRPSTKLIPIDQLKAEEYTKARIFMEDNRPKEAPNADPA